MAKEKRSFVVRKVGQGPYGSVGPWVVRAVSPRGAFQAVRYGWPHWLTDHVRRETHVLECEGATTDRRGKLLDCRAA